MHINSFSFWQSTWFRRWAPLIFIVACFLYGLQNAFLWFEAKPDLSIRVDADTQSLADAVASHPHLAQTWDWWTGPWLTTVPYFRPLSMMGFWAQYHLFGPQGLLQFECLHWFYHGIALTVLWGFFSQIAGRGRAALGVGLFAAGTNMYLDLPDGIDAFNCWKDSADVWHLCFFTASAWTFLNFLRRGNLKLWFLSLAFWFAAVGVKESGYCLPFLLPLLLWHERKFYSHWRFAAVFFALAPLLWLYRWIAIGGWGNATGSNGSWLHRVLVDAVGLPGRIANGDLLSLVPVFGIFILIWLWRARECGGQKSLGVLLTLGVMGIMACVWTTMLLDGGSLSNTLVRMMLWHYWSVVPLTLLLSFIWVQFALRRERVQVFALGWIGVTFIPLTMQPPTSSHVHYPVAPGWSLFLACALWALPESVTRLVQWLKPLSPQRAPQSVV